MIQRGFGVPERSTRRNADQQVDPNSGHSNRLPIPDRFGVGRLFVWIDFVLNQEMDRDHSEQAKHTGQKEWAEKAAPLIYAEFHYQISGAINSY